MTLTCSKSRLCTESTILEFYKLLEARFGAGRPWIMIVDGCSMHRSAEVLEALRDGHPNLTLCLSKASTTDICQPLDLAFYGPLKSELRARCARSMAHDVLQLSAEEVPELPKFKLDTTVRHAETEAQA